LKKKDFHIAMPYILTMVLWWGMLIPAAMSFVGVPHATRSLGAIVPTYIMAAVGLKLILLSLTEYLSRYSFGEIAINFSAAVLFLSVAFMNFNDYFVKYPDVPNLEDSFYVDFIKVGEFLDSLPSEVSKYVIFEDTEMVDPPLFTQTILFAASRDPEITLINLKDETTEIELSGENYVVIPPKYDPKYKTLVEKDFQVELKEYYTDDGFYLLVHGDITQK
jgi:hypothetical protein